MQKPKSTNAIREAFLDYFQKHQHERVPSSSLIPGNDPTLLFTNAGMVQFKDIFLGKEVRPYQRAVSSQRCVRAGGKHNDLENVGYTARHHTFFEMLGNFSFGDYFKREAIHLAWDFLTTVLELPAEKLWITVFKEDEEAADIWLNDIKIHPDRFSRLEEDTNFWAMGPTGPCGPCTEIFYDHGIESTQKNPAEEGDRFIEIWNLVFMQYERAQDGALKPLPKPSVDTGMGLERIAAVMQGVHNNYDIDLFQNLIKAAEKLLGKEDVTSLRVIADHIRSCAFLIADGVLPSNEGRGYVLRRIIRRAIRHGNKLKNQQNDVNALFFYKLVPPLVKEMGAAYPELVKTETHIEKILKQEEEQFNVTLARGLILFEDTLEQLQGNIIPGDVVFKLYDTYGFPVDLTADMARERHLTIDIEGFENAMNKQRERSRSTHQFTTDHQLEVLQNPTEFIGDKNLLLEQEKDSGKITAIYRNKEPVTVLNAGETGMIALDRTPFYAEAGGQVGDQGVLHSELARFAVTDTQKTGQVYLHIGTLQTGSLSIGDKVIAEVDAIRRAATVLNHTATHLLHMILREVLGTHVIQKGSLVEPNRLRFDFSHGTSLTPDEIKQIEQRVNEEIRLNHEADVHIMTPNEATALGAMALFEEKYGDQVRVVQFGDSIELCGGTHSHHTGDIGLFKITSEAGVASGIRRIEAVTGKSALEWLDTREQDYKNKMLEMEDKVRSLEKQLDQLKEKVTHSLSEELLTQVKMIHHIPVLTAILSNVDTKSLRTLVDHLKNKLGSAIIALGVVKDQKVSLIVGVTPDLLNQFKAGELITILAQPVGGKGGGRPDLAEAGGNQPQQLENAFKLFCDWIKNKK